MTISMHSASVPVFVQMLDSMLVWLDKAQAHAGARKFKPENYLGLRLAPDMLPFVSQVRIASDHAKGCVARLAGMDIPKYEDNEATLDELRERIRKTIEFAAEKSGRSYDEQAAKGNSEIPAGRLGRPEEFGQACAFLCSANAGYITGQNLRLDGGLFPGAF